MCSYIYVYILVLVSPLKLLLIGTTQELHWASECIKFVLCLFKGCMLEGSDCCSQAAPFIFISYSGKVCEWDYVQSQYISVTSVCSDQKPVSQFLFIWITFLSTISTLHGSWSLEIKSYKLRGKTKTQEKKAYVWSQFLQEARCSPLPQRRRRWPGTESEGWVSAEPLWSHCRPRTPNNRKK